MAAPYTKIIERDESGYASSEYTIEIYCAGQAPCGPVGTLKNLNSKAFYKRYTPTGQYKPGYSVSMVEAEALFDISSPVNYNRVIPEDALYGGAIVPVGNGTPQSLPTGLASPESYVFAEPTEVKTVETINVLCKEDLTGSLGGTYFFLPGQIQYVAYKVNERSEQATITCSADSQGSLSGTYFMLPGQKTYVWFNVDESSTDPGLNATSLLGKTGVEVKIAANTTALAIAQSIAALSIDGFTLALEEDSVEVTITVVKPGAVARGNAGTSGFAYITNRLGLDEIPSITLDDTYEKIEVILAADATAAQVASTTNNALSGSATFISAIDANNQALLVITAKRSGFMLDAIDGVNATGFVFSTVNQGSNQSGSEALLFYTADPNELDITFRIYSHQDNPSKAPLPNTFVVEVYKDGVLDGDAITCSRIEDLKDGNGSPLYVEQAMLASNYLRCRNNSAVDETELPSSTKGQIKVTGGTPGSTVTTGDMIQAVKPWYNKDDFDITLMMTAGYTDTPYVMELNNIAKTRGDCCVINSVPYYIENTAEYLDNTIKYRKNVLNINSSFIATFSSNLEVYNSSLNKNMYIPSDGYIAGAIVNAARNYEIFYPIIGFKRGILSNVLDVKHRYTREEMDELYNNQINPIRFIPGQGIVIWGQKTMQAQASSLDRLNARLLLCALKPRLQRFLETFIGELNTDKARDSLTLMLNGVFDEIKAKDGILDYKVSCDPLDPNAPNKLSANVKMAITPAIEFVELTLTLTPAGVAID